MKHIIHLLLMLILGLNHTKAQEKIVITKAEDLPKHSYELKTRDAIFLVKSKENILELSAMVKKNLLADLEKYEIKENATLRDYYFYLRIIFMVEGDYTKALELIQKERELSDKESDRIIRGIESEILLGAVVQNKTMEAGTINPQIIKSLEEKLNASNFKIIQEDVELRKGSTEMMSENFIIGIVKSQIQPALDNNKGEIPGNLINDLIYTYYRLNFFIPYKEAFEKAYVNVLEKNADRAEKINIWKEREIAIEENPNYSPVLIGVWDTGVDMPVFPKKTQWINEKEKFDGKDNDGNGFVDDVYGIAYNLEGLKDSNYLEPLAKNLKDITVYKEHIKGLVDLQANINSKEASSLKKYMAQLKPEDVNDFIEKLNLYSIYAHGTHVAGIAEHDNEKAKIMLVRNTFDYKNIPTALTDKIIENHTKMYPSIVSYLKSKKVQIVNMSWGYSYEEVLYNLELNGIGKDDNERKALAKTYYKKLYDSFKKALESAPEILFVCAAGNSDDDVDFTADFPSSLNLPNLMTVGAVDIEGKKTNFTTEGKSVDVYANGYEVESYVPGGERIAFSGTSMASPNAANLAAKILAVNPKLKPEQVIDIIVRTATKSKEDEKVLLVFPKKAVDLASENNYNK